MDHLCYFCLVFVMLSYTSTDLCSISYFDNKLVINCLNLQKSQLGLIILAPLLTFKDLYDSLFKCTTVGPRILTEN